MDKEFEALKTIKIKCHPNSNSSPIVDEALETVEQALTELKAIKEANPSEVLIKLRELRAKPFNWETLIKVLDEVEQALLKAQEQEKVVEE